MAKNTIIENKLLAVDIGGFTLVPIGTIVPYPGEQAPLGWMFCDGRSITQEQYPELYAIVGSKIPDLRGEFIRGLDRGRGIDANRILGSNQGDAIREIWGQVDGGFDFKVTEGAFEKTNYTKYVPQINTNESGYHGVLFRASNVVPTAQENRPRNVAMNYIIKYRHIASHVGVIDSEVELNNKIEDNTNLIQANMGNGGMKFIQTPGQKTKGEIYYDQDSTPKKPYLCIADNTDVTPTSNFLLGNNNNLADYINKLTLHKRHIVNIGTHEIVFNRFGAYVNVSAATQGGSINSVFNSTTLPEWLRPLAKNMYLNFPSVNGTPILAIMGEGDTLTLKSADNGATMHTTTSQTTYFAISSYLVNNINNI